MVIGVGYAVGAQNGFTIELGMSQGKGSDNGSEISHNNTHVSGGKTVNVTSGGDLIMKGAVIDAPKVTADVGGNLSIESLQDTGSQASRQNSSGFNASLCIPPICYGVSTVGGSVASAKANGSFASVTEQSGVKAGDGGFDVNVKGHTDLKGGVISSTQAAIDTKKNSFQTASLATSDIENHSTYKASGYSVSGSVSGTAGDQSTATSDADKAAARNATVNSRPGGSAGVGSASGSQTSTTKAGISGVAGDATVRSDDTAASTGALVKNWDTTSLLKDVQGQAQLTQEFGQRAAYQVGTYADKKYNELKNSDPAEAAKWAEGGEYRVAAHAASGLLAGGVGGALGAGASASLMPRIGEAIADMGLPAPVAQAVGAATAAAIGAAAGGGAGAATAYNVDVNNRQLHPTERGVLRAAAKRVAREQIEGFDQLSPEQQAKAESYWYNQLSAAALARVDDKGQAARDAYVAGVAGTNQAGLQGSLTSAQVLANADVASSVVDRLASQSAPILNMYGEPLQSGGQSLTAFNATAEQRANSYLLNTPTTEAESRTVANANRATLSYLGAINGGAERDYTAEEFLLGGAIGARAVEAIVGVLERGATATAARSPVRPGAYDVGNGQVNQVLLNELSANGVKFTPDNVVAITRSPNGQVVFLETGNSRAGLQHIIGEHGDDFANIGVSQVDIPNVVMRAVSQGKIVGYQGAGTGRPIFETIIGGQPQRIAVTVSNNGFVVGANPAGSIK